MNHPARDVPSEIVWIARLGLDFVDLTLEPPEAAVRQIDLPRIRAALEQHHLPIVGHTAFYLPIGSPFESVRQAAVEELKLCLKAFAELGARWMNVHPDNNAPMHDNAFVIQRNLHSLRELTLAAREYGVGLMIENLPGRFSTVEQLAALLEPLPELGFHLDIGHANLLVEKNTTDELLGAFGSRLRHVHLHDNKGGSIDLHAPLGTGTVDVAHCLRSLKKCGYDGTITLEVFTPDHFYLSHSRDIVRQLWSKYAP